HLDRDRSLLEAQMLEERLNRDAVRHLVRVTVDLEVHGSNQPPPESRITPESMITPLSIAPESIAPDSIEPSIMITPPSRGGPLSAVTLTTRVRSFVHVLPASGRSEERRVGKEWRCGRGQHSSQKK